MMTTDAFAIAHSEEVAHPDTIAIQALGFWLYLMSDLVLFATLFATFAVLSRNYAGGPTGKELFDLPYLLGETLFLLFSSNLWFGRWPCCSKKAGPHRPRRYLSASSICLMEINEFHGLVAALWAGQERFLEFFHPGRDSRYPCDFRADLDGGHDRSGRRQRVDLPRSITADASEYVLAFSGYRLDRHIQSRLPDGSYVNE
jgi:hypothetical protein